MKRKSLIKRIISMISALLLCSNGLNSNILSTNDVVAISNDTRIRVDLNANDGRTNSYTTNANNWIVSGDTPSFECNGVTFKLSNGGSIGEGIRSASCKTLTKSDGTTPTLTMDGVTIKDGEDGGVIKLEISGLSNGSHSLTTWHSYFDNVIGSTLSVSINGQTVANGIKSVTRVTSDYDAGMSYSTFDISNGETVTVLITPENNGDFNSAVLNAFEIDGANPFKSISHMTEDKDTHVEIEKGLTWVSAEGAISHDVYIGINFDSVYNANHDSSEFKGNQTKTGYALDSSYSSLNTYYWRVDEIDQNGTITKGAVLSFQVARLSFPTAEGYGRYARGGRGGRIVEVTNLNDSGKVVLDKLLRSKRVLE